MQGVLSCVTARVASCLFTRLQCKHKFIQVLYRPKLPNACTFTSFTSVSLGTHPFIPTISNCASNLFLKPRQTPTTEQTRTVIKYSWKKAKRKSVGAVTSRFFRLHWGGWIRTIAGRKKKLWKKSKKQKNRFLQHVLCNSTQSKLLDKMVSRFWKKPKYYIEDPYAPYHRRENFPITRKKPWRPEGVDYE